MVLEDEPDRGVAEGSQVVGPELKRVAAVERHRAGGRRLERPGGLTVASFLPLPDGPMMAAASPGASA